MCFYCLFYKVMTSCFSETWRFKRLVTSSQLSVMMSHHHPNQSVHKLFFKHTDRVCIRTTQSPGVIICIRTEGLCFWSEDGTFSPSINLIDSLNCLVNKTSENVWLQVSGGSERVSGGSWSVCVVRADRCLINYKTHSGLKLIFFLLIILTLVRRLINKHFWSIHHFWFNNHLRTASSMISGRISLQDLCGPRSVHAPSRCHDQSMKWEFVWFDNQ